MEIRAVKFRVRHEWRLGVLYHPSRPDVTPAVLMLHGFPGAQKNEDVASELCRLGMTVFLPYFSGCWGSPGRFSLPGLLEDARVALRLLSRYHHVDAGHIGIFGYSMGGWVALRLAASAPISALAVMAPALPREDEPGDSEYLRRNGKVVNISNVQEIWRQYLTAAHEDHPETYVRDIAPTPLFIIQGLKDRLVKPAAARRIWSFAGGPKNIIEFPNEDHEFQNDRPAVTAAVCDWFQTHLAAIGAPNSANEGGTNRRSSRPIGRLGAVLSRS